MAAADSGPTDTRGDPRGQEAGPQRPRRAPTDTELKDIRALRRGVRRAKAQAEAERRRQVQVRQRWGDSPRGATEKEFQQMVLDLAGYLGWTCYHTFDSRRSQPGFPDLVLVRPPRLVFAELKSERGRTTPQQQEWLDLLEGTPAETYLWRPADWDAIRAILDRGWTGE